MSSTGRAYGRLALDQYPTPAWCVHRLLEGLWEHGAMPAHDGHWLEPAAGAGNIIRAMQLPAGSLAPRVKQWTAYELDPRYHGDLKATGATVRIADFLRSPVDTYYDFGLGNNPFGLNEVFVGRMRQVCRSFALLMSLDFLGSKGRNGRFKNDMPDVAILPDRPTFIVKLTRMKNGKLRKTTSDSANFGWFIWPERQRSKGEHYALNETPDDVLRAARKAAPRIEVDE